MKAGLSKKGIVEKAVEMIDERGSMDISLNEIAEELNVKPPALYKHISGLDELKHELTFYGWKVLEERLMRSAVGKSKDDAVISLCYTFRDFAKEHRGLFSAIEYYNSYTTEKNLEVTNGIISMLRQVYTGYGFDEDGVQHFIRIMRGLIQGFCSLEIHNGFGNPTNIDDSFDVAVRTLIDGINSEIKNRK